jgi:DNA-binding transcriptional LysR family regulator
MFAVSEEGYRIEAVRASRNPAAVEAFGLPIAFTSIMEGPAIIDMLKDSSTTKKVRFCGVTSYYQVHRISIMAESPGRYKQNRLQQLRGFCYAARTRSISKAAEKMQLSQPSVSLQIKALEQELGTQLFTRRGPRIELTHDGQRLLELARPLVESIDQLDENFASLRDSADRGIVSIAAGGSTIQYLLPRVVARFTHECPQVDVRLHNVTGKAGLALLREGEVDFAVGPMLETPPDIRFHPLVTYEPMLITRHDHPLAAQPRVTLKDIAKYPLILPPKNQSTYRVVEMVFAEHSLEYDVKLEVGGYDVIKKYVELGLGISIVMSHCLSGADHLHSVPLGRWFPKRTYGLVLRKGAALSPAAERFVDMIRADAKTLQNGRGPRRNARGD